MANDQVPITRLAYRILRRFLQRALDGTLRKKESCLLYSRVPYSEEKTMTIDAIHLMAQLALRYPIFHSERDFQHQLAWLLREQNPGSSLRLEVPLARPSNAMMDVLFRHAGETHAFELKYKTRLLDADVGGERFMLKNQSANDLGRHDFFRDIVRMERLEATRTSVLFLTNDHGYWAGPTRPETVDEQFSMKDGRSAAGELNWLSHASVGTTKGRTDPINLAGSYTMRWHDYSNLGMPAGTFRFLWIDVRL